MHAHVQYSTSLLFLRSYGLSVDINMSKNENLSPGDATKISKIKHLAGWLAGWLAGSLAGWLAAPHSIQLIKNSIFVYTMFWKITDLVQL